MQSRWVNHIGARSNPVLNCHELQLRDIPECARILEEEFPHERLGSSDVRKVWPQLLVAGSLKSIAVEDERQKVVAFEASAFVTDRFAKEVLSKPAPYIACEITRAALGKTSPVCKQASIARSNAGSGLNVCVLHSGLRRLHASGDLTRLKCKITQGFLDLHRGYQVKSIVAEAFGDEELSFYQRGVGFRLIGDYASWYIRRRLPQPPGSERSFLLALTRDEVLSRQIAPLLPLFLYTHPRCSFSPGEQKMLVEALKDQTDQELTASLSLSLSTVKKRWLSIFDKAEGLTPGVFRFKPDREPHKRGAQKRHLLLRYLRDHPEELRPYAPLGKRRTSV